MSSASGVSAGAVGAPSTGSSAFGRRPAALIGAIARISAVTRTARSVGSSPGFICPPLGSKNVTFKRGRFGKRGMSVVPETAAQTIVASGTAAAMRPMPLRARSVRPRLRVPSVKIPTHDPPRSSVIARSSASVSFVPRTTGIWRIPFSTRFRPLTFHSEDFASARIWRRFSAAIPTTTGSQ